jgi:hypothetical protein
MHSPRCRRYLAPVALALALSWTVSPPAMADSQKLRIGYTQRIRIETTDNATHLSPDSLAGSSYMRQRTSLMAQLYPALRMEWGIKLTNEMRYYFVPEKKSFVIDEAIVDLLYARFDSLAGRPVSVTAGRQNITMGEGFVIMDGGPLDGSRSAYFNAFRIDWTPATGHTLTGAYARQTEQDWLLPIVHNQHKKLVDGREEAFFVYYSGLIRKVGLQGYMIRKNIRGTSASTKAEINCIGVRFAVPVAKRLDLVSEIAGQFGDWGTVDQAGLGGYLYLDAKTGWPMHFPKSFQVGALYLSGDDPKTSDYEGWEPMFGRFPKWSDSYIYTLVRERGVAYWTNLESLFAKTALDVTKDVTLSLDYHHLMAPEKPGDRPFPGGDGTTRGDLVIAKLAYTMNPHVSGHVLWETYTPGDFYFDGADSYGWMRMELFLKF